MIVENKAGKVQKMANVVVIVPPSFKEPMKDQILLDNDDLQFQLTALGKPTPSIQWFKDEEELKTDKRTKVAKDKDVATLLIKKVEIKDTGRYRCIAFNDAGKDETEAKIVVNSKPQVLKKLKDIN